MPSEFNQEIEKCEVNLIKSCMSLPVEEKILEIVSIAKDFALLNGAGMRYKQNYNEEILEIAPFVLFPSPFPRRDFEEMIELQPYFNELMYKIAHDYNFLHSCLKRTIQVDEFTAHLWNIYEKVRIQKDKQEMSLAILRSDVMMSECNPHKCTTCKFPPFVRMNQVEVNTIASGFGHLGPVSAEIHRYVLSTLGKAELLPKLPENNALELICSGFINAFDVYAAPKAVVLFIVEDTTYNICDQRFHEYEIIKKRPDIRVLRRSLTQIGDEAILTEDKRLIVDGKEVAVVYFRCGYEPLQYHTEKEWTARTNIELSKAIKCPSISYHLAGSKKVQQELARPGVVEKYMGKEIATRITALFTGLYSLDFGESGDEAIDMAIKNPEKFVLKPQREGGGNNVYGKDIKDLLEKIKNTPEREAYILMDRIQPPLQKNYIIRPNQQAKLEETISELGIFGVMLGSEDKIIQNEYAGHMLRSKLSSVDEGGVSSGHGALDSVFLID